jgi:uncharacterized protein involved in exopolysaccharide biosynthesis
LPEDALSARQAQARLGAVAAQVQRLAARYGARYPDYVEAAQEKTSLENAIVQAVADRADYYARRVVALEAETERKKSEVLALQDTKQAYDILEKKVEASRDTFDLVSSRGLQESLLSRLDTVDVVLLARAVPPNRPMTPPLIVIVLFGAVAGALVGASAAVAIELLEGRLRSSRVLRHLLRAPILAEIEIPKSPRRTNFLTTLPRPL